MPKDRCPGKMVNTPGKRAARCPLCGEVDYEANEGDVCGAPLKGGASARSKSGLKEAVANMRSLTEVRRPLDEPETLSDKDLKAAIVRYLNSSYGPSLKDVRRFGLWMDEMMARTGKTWDELVKELGPKDESRNVKDAVATMRALLEDGDEDVEAARKKLATIVKRYKKFERTDADKPPANGMPYSPRDGRLRVIENQTVHEHSFARQVRIGVAIGGKFAWPEGDPSDAVKQRAVTVDKVKKDVRAVLDALVKAHGGFIVDVYGSSWSPLGWVAPTEYTKRLQQVADRM